MSYFLKLFLKLFFLKLFFQKLLYIHTHTHTHTHTHFMYNRKSFNKILDDQINYLNNYYTSVNKIPKRKEKLEISSRIKMDPILLNRWFQAKRNKEKYNNKIQHNKTNSK